MRIVSVVGARPQFVKLGPVSRALRRTGIEEFVLHTGQHYDYEMSESFFEELRLPRPDVNLGIVAESPARQLGVMVPRISEILSDVRPVLTLVFGDTSSTLAGALASAFAGVPVGHVEAGMRSFNRAMPEELNRVATDHLAELWFTASQTAERNLVAEGIQGSLFAGDVMYDVVLEARNLARARGDVLQRMGIEKRRYVLATVHRAGNTDDSDRLGRILEILKGIGMPVIFPIHPRTRRAIDAAGLGAGLEAAGVRAMKPLPYLETIALAASARRVFTDSGGLQKEAFYLGVPCTTLREETEWVETVELGWNVLAGVDVRKALATMDLPAPRAPGFFPYGDGTAGERIAAAVGSWCRR